MAEILLNNIVIFLKSKAKYFLAVSVTFFAYQLFLLLNSFSAVNRIFERVFHGTSPPSFWSVFWFFSEFVGEIGLLVRFSGACLLLAFLLFLVVKKRTVLSWLRKAVLLEGAYYLFILPFIIYMLTKPYETSGAQLVSAEASLSYILQILLISPAFFVLSTKLSKQNLNITETLKWGAIGIVGFAFALWIKHFLLNIYALPINLNDTVLLVGFLNSALTMFAAALLLLTALLPVIRENSMNIKTKLAGAGLALIGFYFIVYIVVAILNEAYMSFLGLTEIWAISMLVTGLGLILKAKTEP